MNFDLSIRSRPLTWVMFLGLVWGECNAQTWSLTEGMRTAQSVSFELNLSEELRNMVLNTALACDSCLTHWKMHQDSLQRAPLAETEILRAMQRASAEMTACRERRTQQIRAGLPDSLRSDFDNLNPPAKPQVLHFGIHNRMDCKVCKTQSPQP